MPRASASTPASADGVAKQKASRAKHACRICNARRVKCNVTEVQPCSNCAAAQLTCEVLPSRRGRYPRRSKHHDASSSVAASSPGSARRSRASRTQPEPEPEEDTRIPDRPHQQGVRSPTKSRSRSRSVSPAEPGALFFGESNFLTLVPGARARQTGQTARGNKDGKSVDNGSANGLERQRLMFAVPSPQSQPHSRQRHAGSPAQHAGSITVASGSRRPDLSATTMRYLQDEGAFDVPDLQTCLPAIKAYFTWFHPCFPILDRADIARRLSDQTISRILLHGMLFIGATYCDDATIAAMGFADRSEAKRKFYSSARVLFHADWETDRLALIQAIFLMSFWRGKPEDVRDVRYWLGVVLTVAEAHGLHRSQSRRKDSGDARLRRRIWWSIYVRERQAATSLGLPSRIRDEDCDVEPLSEADLEGEEELSGGVDSSVLEVLGSCQPQHVAYIVKMSEIAILLGRIMDVQFLPGRKQTVSVNSIDELDGSLEAWKNSLPNDMQYSDDGNSTLWTCLLHLAYNYCRILIHRNDFLKGGDQDKSVQVVVGAASRISRIAEDMSAQGTLRFGQFHLITSLFGALCIHVICIRRGAGISQRISIHRAQLCLLCLKEVHKYWRINNTVLNLFLHYLDGSIAKHLQSGVDAGEHEATASKAIPDANAVPTQPLPSIHLSDTGAAPATTPHVGSDGIQGDGRPQPMDFFEEQYLGLANAGWEGGGDDALADLSLFLQGDEFMQEGLGFLGRSL